MAEESRDPAGHPVSHTWDQPIELDVEVEFTGPRSKGSISGTLIGLDAKDSTKVFERRWRFRRGKQTIRVKSEPFPKKVQRLEVDDSRRRHHPAKLPWRKGRPIMAGAN